MNLSRRTLAKATLAVLVPLAGLAATSAARAEFPERPITLIVPYAPGGAADSLARTLGRKIGERLGTTVVVDNRAGASGTIGASLVARAAADGYTMLYDATPYSINPHLFAKLPFSLDALQPLTLVSLTPNILIVPANSPFKSIDDLIARAKAKPGSINFASGGAGTVQRLASELFRQRLSLDMVHVGYKSGGPAIADVAAGQVDFMFSTVAASYPLVTAGKLRALAISAPQRAAQLPDVPTVAEKTIPGFEVYEWNGILLPKGTPAPVADKLHRAITESLKEPDVRARFDDLGAKAVGSTPGEFGAFLKAESSKWADVIRAGNIRLD